MSEQQTDPVLTPAPDRTPKPNQVLAEPATVDACRADYKAGADVRQTIARQDARTRR
jgi:hypothetical protein